MRKVITAHSKGGVSAAEYKIHSSHTMAISAGKRYHANLRYAENQSIPFSRRFARVTLACTNFSEFSVKTNNKVRYIILK